jgi:hypothetical protein
MGKHLFKWGFTPNYTVWFHHGEGGRMREEVVRARLESFDDEAGVADMLDDAQQAHFDEAREKEEMEATTQAFLDMMDSAQKPLHDATTVSQLDAIGRLMGLKSDLNMSREGFDKMLTTQRVHGMKSHDFHIWLERLLPAMVRGFLPEHIWQVLAELSYFFRQLYAKELSLTVVEALEKTAPVLVCKLEQIFPPGFFLAMQHLIVHLPYEARMWGPM